MVSTILVAPETTLIKKQRCAPLMKLYRSLNTDDSDSKKRKKNNNNTESNKNKYNSKNNNNNCNNTFCLAALRGYAPIAWVC